MYHRRAVFSLLFASAVAPNAYAACSVPRGAVTVCPINGRDYRVIEASTSPDRRFAFAWTFAAASKPTQRAVMEREGGFLLAEEGPSIVENALVRLSDGAVVARSRGQHFGDQPEYNHTAFSASWSPNSRFVLEQHSGKWSTSIADVYYVADDGTFVGPFRLMEFVRAAAAREMKRTAKRPSSIDARKYVFSLSRPTDSSTSTIGDDGIVRVTVSSEVPKHETAESFEFVATIVVKRSGAGLTGELRSLKPVPANG